MNRIRFFVTLTLFCLSFFTASAQPPEQIVKIIVSPDHDDWLYKPGEQVKFTVSVYEHNNLIRNAKIVYEYGPERFPTNKDSMNLPNGTTVINGGTMKEAGFFRCAVTARVNGREYRKVATAGFDPLTIKPTVANPTDFTKFWNEAKAELAKIPLDSKMTLLPERCTEKTNVYHVSIQNFPYGARVYGILCVPKKPGKYPALLSVPGAGIRPYNGNIAMAERGMITLEIGIHGIPVTMDVGVYNNLASGALAGYPSFNLDDKNRYYYKRVYLGCVRANDFLVSLPEFDGEHLAVTGGSQGGALSIVTAGLDPRVKYLGAYYPALCDVTGYLKGRAGGWPHLFEKNNLASNNKPDKIETCGYYDVVNFARQVKVPGQYTWGYNDETCPPTSMYAAYNVITANKTLFLALETGHYTFPEQTQRMNDWLYEMLTK